MKYEFLFGWVLVLAAIVGFIWWMHVVLGPVVFCRLASLIVVAALLLIGLFWIEGGLG